MKTKFTVTLTFLLIIILTACGQTKSKSKNEKSTFDLDQIDRIEIFKYSTHLDTKNYAVKVLTKAQVKSFSNKWNQSDKSELRKYLPSYNLTVYLKSGATRHFRIVGKYIKESNDYCFDFIDANYFSNLYSNAEVLTFMTDSIDKANNESVVASGDNITKAFVFLKDGDSTINLIANIKKDHRIFGYVKPDVKSERLLLLSVFTNDVQNNPFGCKLGAYYDTRGMTELTLKYISTTGNFVKAAATNKANKSTTIYFEKKWIAFE